MPIIYNKVIAQRHALHDHEVVFAIAVIKLKGGWFVVGALAQKGLLLTNQL
jgi:hypothetical protein